MDISQLVYRSVAAEPPSTREPAGRLTITLTLPPLPAEARAIDEPPGLWARDPPVRFRKLIPTSWIELTLREGRNRQVRRMTAAIGHPTLRLVRWQIGDWTLDGITPGAFTEIAA